MISYECFVPEQQNIEIAKYKCIFLNSVNYIKYWVVEFKSFNRKRNCIQYRALIYICTPINLRKKSFGLTVGLNVLFLWYTNLIMY